jgi:hypothetical protein
MPVERADADTGALGDVLERRGAAELREDVARCGDELLVVAPGVGPHRALELDVGLGHRI